MDASERSRFGDLYARHVRALKLQGKAPATVDGYARALRRITAYFDRCPDQQSVEDFAYDHIQRSASFRYHDAQTQSSALRTPPLVDFAQRQRCSYCCVSSSPTEPPSPDLHSSAGPAAAVPCTSSLSARPGNRYPITSSETANLPTSAQAPASIVVPSLSAARTSDTPARATRTDQHGARAHVRLSTVIAHSAHGHPEPAKSNYLQQISLPPPCETGLFNLE